MLIPNHFSLNIAYQGEHFARVEFNQSELVAKLRAKQIADALRATFGAEGKWSFALVHVECNSHSVKM